MTASNDNGTYTFAYDPAGRVTNVQEPFGVSLTYAYDGNGNQTEVADSFGGVQTSIFDPEARLLTREYSGEGQQLRIDYTYDGLGMIDAMTRYSNLAGTSLVATTIEKYDGIGNVTTIATTDGTTAIAEFDYTYDQGGNMITEVDNGVTTAYSYDPDDQLVASTSSTTTSYSYDANGNREGTGITTGQDNELTAEGGYTYTYDARGNEITKSGGGITWTYAYNAGNELVSAVETGTSTATIDYMYDVFGNLIEEDATIGSSSTVVTKYAVDGWNPALAGSIGTSNFNTWAVINGGNGTLQTRNLFGDQVSQIIGRIDVAGGSGTTYWDLTDKLGSVCGVINNSATVVDSIQYDAYGNILPGETAPAYRGMYAWTGQQLDVETGLQYNRARWYDSSTGRWISQDPMGFDAGDSNLYRYVNNAPTDAIDPSGLQQQTGRLFTGDGNPIVFPQNAPNGRAYVARYGHLPANMPAWFARLDTDKDGQILLYEWLAAGQSLQSFNDVANGEESITPSALARYLNNPRSPNPFNPNARPVVQGGQGQDGGQAIGGPGQIPQGAQAMLGGGQQVAQQDAELPNPVSVQLVARSATYKIIGTQLVETPVRDKEGIIVGRVNIPTPFTAQALPPSGQFVDLSDYANMQTEFSARVTCTALGGIYAVKLWLGSYAHSGDDPNDYWDLLDAASQTATVRSSRADPVTLTFTAHLQINGDTGNFNNHVIAVGWTASVPIYKNVQDGEKEVRKLQGYKQIGPTKYKIISGWKIQD